MSLADGKAFICKLKFIIYGAKWTGLTTDGPMSLTKEEWIIQIKSDLINELKSHKRDPQHNQLDVNMLGCFFFLTTIE